MDCKRAPWILLAPACLTLSSCQLSVPIKVEQLPDGSISIATMDDEDDPACIDDLTISSGPEVGARILWNVSIHSETTIADKCVSRIIYPTVPPGYYLATPAIPLEKGRKYTVNATGPGFGTDEEFVRR